MSKKRIPVGQDNFKQLIEDGYYFVDKSRFIKDLIENRDRVNLITRPRRFGKTLNMSMLKYFFDISTDNQHLFTDLDIARETDICGHHMGQYPVISLTFMNAKQDSYEMSLASLKAEISREFLRHREAVAAYKHQRNRIDAIINGDHDGLA